MQSRISKTIVVTCTIGFVLLALNLFKANFNLETSQDIYNTTSQLSQNWASGGSAQKIEASLTGLGGMLSFAPIGIFTALFRPLPGEVLNVFGLMAGFENFFLLGLFLLAIKKNKFADLKHPIVALATSYILVWSLLYGYISFQNLGSAARFKLQVLPVFLLLLFYLINHSKHRNMADEQT